MKIIILLEPPYSIISLELEETAIAKKFTYFSLSDVYPSETGGESDIAKQMQSFPTRAEAQSFAYAAILKKHLKNPPKSGPNGFILDSDCIESPEEVGLLLDILTEMGHAAPIVLDIKTPMEECLDNVDDLSWEEDATAEVERYFQTQYTQLLTAFQARGLRVMDFEVIDKDERALNSQFIGILAMEE